MHIICIWGSRNTDKNGEVIEEFMEENSFVCLNDGNPTRIDIIRGAISCLDITIVSASLAGKCLWSVSKDNIGSDHFPVICEIQNKIQIQNCNFGLRWIYKKADSKKIKMLCEEQFENLSVEGVM